jgi:hypothetical protein
VALPHTILFGVGEKKKYQKSAFLKNRAASSPHCIALRVGVLMIIIIIIRVGDAVDTDAAISMTPPGGRKCMAKTWSWGILFFAMQQ